ncbi:uncharacterized protein LOC117219343 [Megalopta genalis]|uniref:uncharacterized protein LOC117219343 n=1 Tax=Megalopta genalis TaxID=115081 RepID=UPI003FD5857E
MSACGPYTICPFNAAHRIIDGRIQRHILKCRKSYPKDIKVTCPFDATHVLNPEEYEHHLLTCISNGNVMCYRMTLEPGKQLGTVLLEDACNVQTDVISDEDWSGNNPTYNALAVSEAKNVMRSAVGLSKSKKKQFKRSERERIAQIENEHNNTTDVSSIIQKQPVVELETPLRMPKNVAKAIYLDQTLDYSDKDIYIGDLVSKLRKVDLKKDSSLLEENVSTINNSFSQESHKENSANNIYSDKNSNSARSSQESTSKKNINMTRNDVKSCEKSKETDTKNNSIRQYLNKERTKRVNLQIAATIEEARKISTGRGFTIAYQKIRSEINESNKEDISLDHYKSVFGYEENENDDTDDASQET